MTRRKQARGEYTRLALLRAAGELFAEKGYEGTSVKDLIGRAGASVGSFYHHFKDKADLFTQVIDEGSVALRRYLREVRSLPPSVSLEERSRRAYTALFDFAEEHRSLFILFLSEGEKLPPHVRRIVEEDLDRYREEQRRDLEAAVRLGWLKPFDAPLGSEAVFGMVVQLLSVYFSDPHVGRAPVIDAMTRSTVGILRAMSGAEEPAWTPPPKKADRGGKGA